MSLTHVEESGTYDCRVRGDPDDFIQFHVMVNENCESNENCSSEASFSINPTIDVHTTISSIPRELSQLELLERLEKFMSGDGLINDKTRGVCSIWWFVLFFFSQFFVVLGCFIFFLPIALYDSFRCLFMGLSA